MLSAVESPPARALRSRCGGRAPVDRARPGMWCRRGAALRARSPVGRLESNAAQSLFPKVSTAAPGKSRSWADSLLVRVPTLEQTGTESHDHRQSGNEGAA